MEHGTLALVGLGNMGEALVKGILDQGLLRPQQISGAEKLSERAQEIRHRYDIAVHPSARAACAGAETVLVAVKPQDLEPTLGEISESAAGALVVSVCAGVTLARLSRHLPPETAVVRVMPNTPALVGAGASVYCANAHVAPEQRRRVEALLGAVGTVHSVDREELLDAVTGLSGSGPAYVFTFLEALADAGVLMGLSRALARELACQTVLGAAQLARDSGEHPAELRDRVTSPGGTTAADLKQLELGGFRGSVLEAVQAATLRSRELGG